MLETTFGISSLIEYFINNIASSPFMWDWAWIKLKIMINFISLLVTIVLISGLLYHWGIKGNKYWKWENADITQKDIVGTLIVSFLALLFWTPLGQLGWIIASWFTNI